MNKEKILESIKKALKEYFSNNDYYYNHRIGALTSIEDLELVSDIDINAMLEEIKFHLKESE